MYQKKWMKHLTLENVSLELDYYIVGNEQEGYGVCINSYNSQTAESECSQIDRIFVRKAEAESFCELLVHHQVTPITLLDVVEDFIAI